MVKHGQHAMLVCIQSNSCIHIGVSFMYHENIHGWIIHPDRKIAYQSHFMFTNLNKP